MSEQSPLNGATTKAGAIFQEAAGWAMPAHYGDSAREYAATRTRASLFDQSHRGKVELTGKEAAAFFHNLCSADINNLPLGGGAEFFLTTAKAKVVSHGYVFHIRLYDNRDALWLDVPPGQAEPVIKHLDHFLISEQVEFADRTREFAQVHLAGPESQHVLEKALVDDVPALGELQHMVRTFGTDATASIRRHDVLGLPGYDIVCLGTRAPTVWDYLVRSGAMSAGLEAFNTLRVEAGTPVYGQDLDENTFAFEAGRTPQAICYTKGCFLGQEPIVMARDRGQANRNIFGLKLTGEPVPHGSPLFRDGKEIGRALSSVLSPRFGSIALASIRRGNQEPNTALEVEVDGQRRPALVAALPFSE